MCLFFETVCINNSVPQKLCLHNARLNRTRFDNLGIKNELDLASFLKVPEELKNEKKIKCKVIYSKDIEQINYSKYTPKSIKCIKLIECNDINYKYKYLDRKLIDFLYSQRSSADDILICKNGFPTDTSIHNIALFNGSEWHTPAEPLLCGVQREYLIQNKIIIPKQINTFDLKVYSQIRLFNAMNEWDECTELSLSDVIT
jgi:4-amino-4-deoxychorismate lyase